MLLSSLMELEAVSEDVEVFLTRIVLQRAILAGVMMVGQRQPHYVQAGGFLRPTVTRAAPILPTTISISVPASPSKASREEGHARFRGRRYHSIC